MGTTADVRERGNVERTEGNSVADVWERVRTEGNGCGRGSGTGADGRERVRTGWERGADGGRTGVYKWRGPLTYPTPLLLGAQTTLLCHRVWGSGALGRVKDPFFGILSYFFLSDCVGVLHVSV
jgi:hypothetical protein